MSHLSPRSTSPARRRRRGLAAAAVALTAAVTMSACEVTPDQSAAPGEAAVTAAAASKVWANFDKDLQGWTVGNGKEAFSTERMYSGAGSMKITSTRTSTALSSSRAISPSVNESISASGSTLSVFVKLETAPAGSKTARIAVGDTAGKWTYGPSVQLTAGTWVKVSWAAPKSVLDSKRNVGVSLDTQNLTGNVAWFVDNYIQEGAIAATTTTAKPTTTVAPTTTAKPATTTTAKPATTTTVKPTTTVPVSGIKFPGDVRAGSVRFGASYNSNTDPAPRENAAGGTYGVRRTFWQWSDRTGSMVSTSKTDISKGRLPWVSIKPPSVSSGSAWKAVGDGKYDAELTAMFKALGTVPGPVWFSIHHEPEGGGGSINGGPDDIGGAAEWRRMQTRVSQVLDASGVTNVAFSPILMSWTWDSRSGRNPADWYVPGIWDFAGIDHYNTTSTGSSMLLQSWANTRSFYTQKGLKIGIGEWGMHNHTSAGAQGMQDFYNQAIQSGTSGQAQVIGMAYFDTTLNGGDPLDDQILVKFNELLRNPKSIKANSNG